jgi:hypothetical protein
LARTGGCNALMGCANISDPADRQLCQTLLGCMNAHPTCWATNPATCLCGTAQGLQCTTSPNGVCLTEAVAATKAGPNDYTTTGTRFYDTRYPSGHATQEIVCDEHCMAAGNSCP